MMMMMMMIMIMIMIMMMMMMMMMMMPLFSCDDASRISCQNLFAGDRRQQQQQQHDPFAFVPFGAGPRRCLGERLALLEGKLAAAVLLQRFEFRDVRPGGLDLEEDAMGLTMYPVHGMPLAVARRARTTSSSSSDDDTR
jgi:hypothetical protein